MKALALSAGRFCLEERPDPCATGECVVRVLVAGICGTDLQLLEGYAGFAGVPGHEFVGIVERAPPADAPWIGQRVVAEINVGCGACSACASGVKEHCARRTVIGIRGRDGAFAERVAVPAVNLHAVDERLTDEEAVFAEPVAAACRILEQVDVTADMPVAVLGDGRLGLIAAQVLRASGARVDVFGRHAEKLAVARRLGFATHEAEARREDAARFAVVVDATGRPHGLRDALALVRPRGIVVLKSTFHGEAPMATWPVVVDEVTIVGSRCGPFAPALDLLRRGAVNVGPLVAGVFSLEAHEDAFAAARRALKVLFRIGS